jgi:hypothetical protein
MAETLHPMLQCSTFAHCDHSQPFSPLAPKAHGLEAKVRAPLFCADSDHAAW